MAKSLQQQLDELENIPEGMQQEMQQSVGGTSPFKVVPQEEIRPPATAEGVKVEEMTEAGPPIEDMKEQLEVLKRIGQLLQDLPETIVNALRE